MPILAADVTFGYLQESRDVHAAAGEKGVKFNPPDASWNSEYEAYLKNEIARVKEEGKKRGVPNADELVELYLDLMKKWARIDAEEIRGDKQKFVDALNREVYSKVSW
jgi:hypothetical protein